MDSWFEKTILDGIKELNEEKTREGWFSVNAINNVPHIKYPFLSDEQNEEIYEQARQVLILSRTQNQYKETSITYSIDNSDVSSKYIKVFGNINSIQLMDNAEVKSLITGHNESDNLAVVTLHNHPNSSGFSAMDVLIFANNPSIMVMEILNTKGEISFLARPTKLNLKREMMDILSANIPDIATRMSQWKENNPHDLSKMSLVDISSIEERNRITKDCINTFANLGVFYSGYIDQEKAKKLTFVIAESISNEGKEVNTSEMPFANTPLSSEQIIVGGDDYER